MLTSSGSMVSGWTPGTGCDGPVYAITQRPQSQTVLIGGAFSSYASLARNKVSPVVLDAPSTGLATWGPAPLSISAIYATE